MKVPLSWLKDYVDIDLSLIELSDVLTMAGLEVEGIQLVGLPNPYEQADAPQRREVSIQGLSWDPEKIVVAQIDEVMPHPNADRLVLCRLNDGTGELIVLTGAPNLFEFKGIGPLKKPIKVAYAREGARLYDGHQPGLVLTTLKRTKIRGVESFSMVCSEKELGISEEHEGIMILDDAAPTGMPLVDYMGDAVLEVNILPNMIRDSSMVGIAREVAALTQKALRKPQVQPAVTSPTIEGKAHIQITDPTLNPRFVLGMVEGAEQRPSPYKVQLRLRLAGMRPINAVVDATNYVMLEIGQPLHAFDYDVLVKRAGGTAPTIITRAARPGETLTTLDGVDRKLDDFTVLVCDTAGALSLAGVMGGLESEITPTTRNILLEGATWNFINTRRTTFSQKLVSEAGYRFSRGVHPALAEEGVRLCLQRMAEWTGGVVYSGLVDEYPLPAVDPEVSITPADVKRLIGIDLTSAEIASMLERLEFTCQISGDEVVARTPPHRLDIGTGVIGKADLAEEVARIYGYDRIPATNMASELPDARDDRPIKIERLVRETLARLGLQEVINYRLTSPEREARLTAAQTDPAALTYLAVKNPLSPERSVLRRSLLASVLDSLEKNARLSDRLALFEVGPVFLPLAGEALPDETPRLAIAMTGRRQAPAWDAKESPDLDFFDLKGIIEGLLDSIHIKNYFIRGLDKPINFDLLSEMNSLINHKSFIPECNLSFVKGLGEEYVDLLGESGITTIAQLSISRPSGLLAAISEVNAKRKILRKLPTIDTVTEWVDQARDFMFKHPEGFYLFHPGKSAKVTVDDKILGVFGELHPLVKGRYDFQAPPVLAAEFDLTALIAVSASRYDITPVPVFPPVLEDLALIVDESVPAADVEAAIRQGGGKMLAELRLFDIFRGEQIGEGKKSLAYALSYQSPDHTLSPGEANQIRQRIIRRVEQLVGAQLRA